MVDILLWLLFAAACYPSNQTHRSLVYSPTPHQTNGAIAIHYHNMGEGGRGEESVHVGGKGAGWMTHTHSILRPTQKLLQRRQGHTGYAVNCTTLTLTLFLDYSSSFSLLFHC